MRPSVGIGVLVCACTVVLAGIVAGAGCTVLTNDGPPDDAGPFDSGDAASPVCATCLANECTGQMATCLSDPACAALAKCTGSACVCTAPSDSDASDPDAGAAADPRLAAVAFASCNAARAKSGGACATDCTGTNVSSNVDPCGVTDGGVTDSGSDATDDAATNDAGDDAGDDASVADASTEGGSDAGTTTPPAVTVDGCASCISGTCGDAKKSCAIGTECAAYLECAYGAADAAAVEECGRQHATGKTAAVGLATCTRVGCSDACGL